MSTTTFDTELKFNQAAYERERTAIRHAGPGYYVAIASGRVIALTLDFDEAVRAVHELTPPPEHYLVFPADEEPIYDLIDDFQIEFE